VDIIPSATHRNDTTSRAFPLSSLATAPGGGGGDEGDGGGYGSDGGR
jgi:hypothetical protein